MAQLLIWGETREILTGEMPAGIQIEEVKTLAAVEEALAGRLAGAMVVADPRCVEAEGEATAAWLRNGGSAQAFLVTVTDQTQRDEVLARLPFVEDVLERPITPVRLLRKLEQALDVVRNRRIIRQLEEKLDRRGEELSELNEIGVKLSAERDIPRLLDLILRKSREITGADAGSLYLVQRAKEADEGNGDRLLFELAQNDSVAVPFKKQTMPLNETSIAGYVALTGEPVNVPDAYHPPEGSPYTISRSFDEKSGYRSRSMLVVPMRDHENVVQGVVQLINKKRDRMAILSSATLSEEEVIPFTSEDEKLASSLASQAAVAFENADLIDRIQKLFDQFIRRAVTAVEMRDPVTAGHSERVAILSVGLIQKVDAVSAGPLAGLHFTPEQVEELRYAALLHDFGKVAVQEKVLGKRKKLHATRLVAVRQRFAYIAKSLEADYLRKRLDAIASGSATPAQLAALEAEYERRRAESDRLLGVILRANEPTVVEEESVRTLDDLPARVFRDHDEEERFPVEDWAQAPHLTAAELEALSIRKGTLTATEREEINSHVSHTYEFLQKLPWTGEFRRVPEIAWAHHEKLDGSGYPRGIKAAEIPVQSRMMTIADIFDALVAQDRPYKKAVSPERALEILEGDVRDGRVDGDLFRMFVDAKIFDLAEFKALIKARH
ncbi:MAG TPA: HD domain-containing phosphohydrolase [Vicinamibacteria bacterium]|nr:HD domain-containing phosphohydrolase [Vicinamibacteria bacterium]